MSERVESDSHFGMYDPQKGTNVPMSADPTPAGTGAGEPSEAERRWAAVFVETLYQWASHRYREEHVGLADMTFGSLTCSLERLAAFVRAAPVAADAPSPTEPTREYLLEQLERVGISPPEFADEPWTVTTDEPEPCEDGMELEAAIRQTARILTSPDPDARPEAGAPDDLRDEIERMKRNTVDVIDRGKEPYLNGASLVILFDKILTRIEALEAHRAATPPEAASGTRETSEQGFARKIEAIAFDWLHSTGDKDAVRTMRRIYDLALAAMCRAAVPPPSGEPGEGVNDG